MLGLTVFSAMTEVIQIWVPGRTARLSDFAQDVMGAVVGVTLMALPQAMWMRFGQARDTV
ncbi:MAG: VanZ family protein [Burkholderiaceae bacterium]